MNMLVLSIIILFMLLLTELYKLLRLILNINLFLTTVNYSHYLLLIVKTIATKYTINKI